MLERRVVQIAPNTWLLSEYNLVNMFLAVGEEKAALIDTGVGIGDVVADIRKITDKPLVVIITHGHLDHCLGADGMPEVYMHSDDETNSQRMHNKEGREWYVKTRSAVWYPGHTEELLAMLPKEEKPFSYKPLVDGQVIDLGGRTLEVIHAPGHSEGSISLLDKANRIMFTGDTANVSLVIPGKTGPYPGPGMEVYNQSLHKLWNRQEEYDHIAVGHTEPALRGKYFIEKYADITSGILDGTIVGQYEEVGIRKGKVHREGELEIWYDPIA